jgi:conjugative relaxase-like TrwC/TraI family protein
MLSIAAMKHGQADYYLELAREDYYLQGGEPPGVWWGSGAAALNLRGTVEPEALRQLLQGFGPDGSVLTQNAGHPRRQCGWDLSFSAPKTVSVLWSQADPDTRRVIEEAHFAAVKAALTYLEDTAAFSRIGKGGTHRVPAGMVVAAFEHGTSRALDPQLHTHCLVLNIGVRPDGTTGSIVSRPLYEHKMAGGAIYRTELAAQLTQRLGLTIRPEKSWFEIEGVSKALAAEFSKRRAAIKKELAARGLRSAAAAAYATLATREVKGVVPPREELFKHWQAIGAAHGFRASRGASSGFRASKGASSTTHGTTSPTDRQVVKHVRLAIESILNRASHFSEREVFTACVKLKTKRPIKADVLRSAVREVLTQSPEIVRLGERSGEIRYTTREMLQTETKLLETARSLAAARSHAVKPSKVEEVIEKLAVPRSVIAAELKHHATQLVRAARGKKTEPINREQIREAATRVVHLSEEQRKAVFALTAEPGRLKVLSGIAGSGKTEALRVCREVWEATGHRVIGASLAGKAARQLERSTAIESDTLAMLEARMKPSLAYQLKHHGRQLIRAAKGRPTFALERLKIDKKTVLVIDEAGMVGTRQLARLIDAVQKGGGKVVLAGESRQLQAIEAGGPLRALEKGEGVAKLKEIIRQKDKRDKDVVKDLADGKAASALRSLAERGLLTVSRNLKESIDTLVATWRVREAAAPQGCMILTGTNRDAADVNRRCQMERAKAGHTDPSRSIRIDDGYLNKGDRVILRKLDRSLDVSNGDLGTVTAVHPLRRRLDVLLDDGRKVLIPLNDYKHDRGPEKGKVAVSLGYAVTTHKGAGTTVENSYVLVGGYMQDRELSYVQASRAKGSTYVFADKERAGAGLVRLIEQMRQSRAKDLATDVLKEQAMKKEQRLELRLAR